MEVLCSTHDDLYELHYCPECDKYWVYCTSCGYLSDYSHEAIKATKSGTHLIKCERCGEPFWIDKYLIKEVCPPCAHWNNRGEYKTWVEVK